MHDALKLRVLVTLVGCSAIVGCTSSGDGTGASHATSTAVLTAAIAGHPDRMLTLVATDAGVPLYWSMGFQTVSTAVWHVFGG